MGCKNLSVRRPKASFTQMVCVCVCMYARKERTCSEEDSIFRMAKATNTYDFHYKDTDGRNKETAAISATDLVEISFRLSSILTREKKIRVVRTGRRRRRGMWWLFGA